jgi:hypothetical protein
MSLIMSNNQFLTNESNIFVNEAKILSITVEEDPFPDSKYPAPDLAIRVKFDVGASFEPEDLIVGNFKKDEVTGEVLGWGSAFKVGDFFLKALDLKDIALTDDNKIPEEYMKDAIGKSVLRLTYAYSKNIEGKNKYKPWNKFGDVSKSPEILIKGFNAQVEKGYIKDFIGGEVDTKDLPNMFPEDDEAPF